MYNLDITNLENHPFINIQIVNGRCLLSAYTNDKTLKKVCYINKKELGLLIQALQAVDQYFLK